MPKFNLVELIGSSDSKTLIGNSGFSVLLDGLEIAALDYSTDFVFG